MLTSVKTTSKAKRPHWIAERALERLDAVGGRVVVRIGCPEWPPGAEEWRCPFEIRGLGEDIIKYGHGTDSMSALQNAMTGVRCHLVSTRIPLRWEGFDEEIIGFPVTVPMGFGLAFQQRIEKMIEAEVDNLVRPIREREEVREAQRKARRQARAKRTTKKAQKKVPTTF